jgi:NAD(P)-dependent dehydrogenase (short-subunit alcohol dehydrogenase family)
MNLNLNNKRALVTASTAGIGFAIPTESEVVNSLVNKHAQQLGVSDEAYKRDIATNSIHANLIRRFAKAEEVAHMATYLCSELASVTTGSPIRADGGTLRSAF